MKKKILSILLVLLGGAALGAGGVYGSGLSYYQQHFYNGTKVILNAPDGATEYAEGDLSDMTPEDAESYLAGLSADYVLTISEPDGSEEQISASDISLELSDDGKTALEDALSVQDYKLWFLHAEDWKDVILNQRVTVDQTVTASLSYDEAALDAKIDTLKCINPDEVAAPENAYLTYDETTLRYVVAEGKAGNQGLKEPIEEKINTALTALADTAVLDSSDYEQPEITVEDETLCAKRDEINKYLSASITLKDGDTSYVIDAEEIIGFLDIDDEWNVTLSTSKINKFIAATLDPLFDTRGKSRTITTVSSGTFTVSGGTFGRMVQTARERPMLIEEITNGETVEREPCYYAGTYEQTTENDGIGNTYIDVNIAAQTVTYVKDGKEVISMSCVTGNTSEGRGTPTGIYYITRKLTEYTMVKYDSFVHYWMPIDDSIGVGLHDATWRSNFGGNIYKTNGSHGCINLPLKKAEELYNAVSAGTIVIVH